MRDSRQHAKPPRCPRAAPASAGTSIRTGWLFLTRQRMQTDSQTRFPPDLRHQSAGIFVLVGGWIFNLILAMFSRLPQHVFHSPLLHVDGEHAFVEQRSPELGFGVRMFDRLSRALEHAPPYLARDKICLTRICIFEHQHGVEEQLPVLACEMHQAVPVQTPACSVDHVRYVSSVVPLSEEHEHLRCDQLFRRQYACLDASDLSPRAALDPGIVYRNDAVAHSSDQVNVEVIAPRL